MIRILLYALLAWFLYRLIFHFIVPVVKTTRQMKRAFRDMHDRMQQSQAGGAQFDNQQSASSNYAQQAPPSRSDYIDFEEIK